MLYQTTCMYLPYSVTIVKDEYMNFLTRQKLHWITNKDWKLVLYPLTSVYDLIEQTIIIL